MSTYRINLRFAVCASLVIGTTLGLTIQNALAQTESKTATSTCETIDSCGSILKSHIKKAPRKVISKDYGCSGESKPRSSFKVCNDEEEVIKITNFFAGEERLQFATLVAPKLPVKIKPRACTTFVIKSGAKRAYRCGGFFDVILATESDSPEGELSGNIAIGL